MREPIRWTRREQIDLIQWTKDILCKNPWMSQLDGIREAQKNLKEERRRVISTISNVPWLKEGLADRLITPMPSNGRVLVTKQPASPLAELSDRQLQEELERRKVKALVDAEVERILSERGIEAKAVVVSTQAASPTVKYSRTMTRLSDLRKPLEYGSVAYASPKKVLKKILAVGVDKRSTAILKDEFDNLLDITFVHDDNIEILEDSVKECAVTVAILRGLKDRNAQRLKFMDNKNIFFMAGQIEHIKKFLWGFVSREYTKEVPSQRQEPVNRLNGRSMPAYQHQR